MNQRELLYIKDNNPHLTKLCLHADNPHDPRYAIYLQDEKSHRILSPFHGINLYPYNNDRGIVNMVVEIPKNTQLKMEIDTYCAYNPIVYDTILTEDTKEKVIRKITYNGGYPAHYGAIPQTWENSMKPDHFTNIVGDNDPVDCFDISTITNMCNISNMQISAGTIIKVKVLGAIAMIDQNEMDWKIITINIMDPISKIYNNIYDIPKEKIIEIIDFLQNYKVPEGKPKNNFYEKIVWSKREAIEIIEILHKEWKELQSMNIEEMSDKVKLINRVSQSLL
jgi:inorganic pyrophosphatase